MTPLGIVVAVLGVVVGLPLWVAVIRLLGPQALGRAVGTLLVATGVLFVVGGFVNLATGGR